MFLRTVQDQVALALQRQAVTAILGPRQVGKTTLAIEIGRRQPSVYLDLEDPADRAKLAEPRLYLDSHADKLVILDEIHRVPDIFPVLRGVIDRGRRAGRGVGRFLVLGSASVDLLRQSGESLAGRISFVELSPLRLAEVGDAPGTQDTLWLRGGFPGSYLAIDDQSSAVWRADFVRTYLERDVAVFSPRIPSEMLRRAWVMLAHHHGSIVNVSELSRNLGVSAQSVTRYIDLLVDLMLVRRLLPLHSNAKKRLVKSPKIYIRDTGLVHSLLGIRGMDDLLAHPVIGTSWESFVIENVASVLPDGSTMSFYRTASGAEMDLVADLPGGERWTLEIKRSLSPSLGRGGYEAIKDLRPKRAFVIYPGSERFPVAAGVEVIGLDALIAELR